MNVANILILLTFFLVSGWLFADHVDGTHLTWLFVTFLALSGLSVGVTRYFCGMIRLAKGNLEESQRLLAETSRLTKLGGWKVLLPGMEGLWSEEAARVYDLAPGQYFSAEEGIKYYHPDDLPVISAAFERAISEHIPYDLQLRLTSVTGRQKWIRTTGYPVIEDGKTVAVQGIIQDITEQVLLEQQLRQSQKMEAIGNLAGGVAHDFNNMLGVILGHTDLLMETLSEGHSSRESVEAIRDTVQRSSDLTRQLLTFARQQHVEPIIIDTTVHIEKMAGMLQRLIGEQISLGWKPPKEDMPVLIDPSQLDQILVNLVVNARDAIAGTGTIEIAVQRRAMSEEEALQNPETMEEMFIVLTVTDDGRGMSEDTCERIFEPFFTTKPVGKSTGLGLATVFGIIRQNRGFIHVSSQPGEGSVFTVGLPLAETQEP